MVTDWLITLDGKLVGSAYRAHSHTCRCAHADDGRVVFARVRFERVDRVDLKETPKKQNERDQPTSIASFKVQPRGRVRAAKS